MLALWLLASNHAIFEVAGLMASENAPEPATAQLRWHQVEHSLTKQKTEFPTKPATLEQVLPVLDLLVLADLHLTPRAESVIAPVETEQRISHIWHFVQRAAPLPGAPSARV